MLTIDRRAKHTNTDRYPASDRLMVASCRCTLAALLKIGVQSQRPLDQLLSLIIAYCPTGAWYSDRGLFSVDRSTFLSLDMPSCRHLSLYVFVQQKSHDTCTASTKATDLLGTAYRNLASYLKTNNFAIPVNAADVRLRVSTELCGRGMREATISESPPLAIVRCVRQLSPVTSLETRQHSPLLRPGQLYDRKSLSKISSSVSRSSVPPALCNQRDNCQKIVFRQVLEHRV